MNVKRYTIYYNERERDMYVAESQDGKYCLHSDYAALLASYNALRDARDKLAQEIMRLVNMNEQLHERLAAIVEAVAWERETDECGEWLHIAWWDNPKIDLLDIWDIHHAARAEVDRLLLGES